MANAQKQVRRKLQVFVSSTYSDLMEERQAAVAAILKSGHIPAGMELFTAGDKTQLKTIQDWIDDSDIYMLILGGRYGTIEPSSGLSYTELEYDYALSQGKPTFAVVMNNHALELKIRSSGTDFGEKKNPVHLERFRVKVLSNISSFFSDAKDIKLCVYESLSDFAADPNLRGWIPAGQLPQMEALVSEQSRLQKENLMLSERILELQRHLDAQTKLANEHVNADTKAILKAMKVVVPASITSDQKEKEIDLLNLTYNNRAILINGVTNSGNASNVEEFFYWHVMPKLQTQGLVENEKVAGVQYRRSALNKTGRAFMASLERYLLLEKKSADPDGSQEGTNKAARSKREPRKRPNKLPNAENSV